MDQSTTQLNSSDLLISPRKIALTDTLDLQVIRRQYAQRHEGSPTPTVRFNDLAFGLHAWVLCVLTYVEGYRCGLSIDLVLISHIRRYSQFWPRLWGWKKIEGVNRKANKVSLGLLAGSFLAVAITTTLVLVEEGDDASTDAGQWAWLDVVSRYHPCPA